MPVATLTAEFDRLIQVGPARYTYYLRLREDAARLRQLLADLAADRFILLTDKKVPARHLARMHARLSAVAPCTMQAVTPGEDAKTLAGVMDLADAAIQAGVTRRSVVVSFGGPQTVNVAGLLAALLYSGVRLVHIPTTLRAMCDSALTLKQTVHSKEGRNHLGTFLIISHRALRISLSPSDLAYSRSAQTNWGAWNVPRWFLPSLL